MPTPGLHQYYKVHHALMMPDEVKWQVKMCERLAMSEYGVSYKEDGEKSIASFLKGRLNFDYLGGNRELNLDLTI